MNIDRQNLCRSLRSHDRRPRPPRRYGLIVEVESDRTVYGDEVKFGGGKVIRDGMGQSPEATRAGGAPDLVITNALILDYTGIYKADVAIRDGRIAAIGKAGKSRHHGWRHARNGNRSVHGDSRGRRPHSDSRRHRYPYSFHFAQPDSGSVLFRQ